MRETQARTATTTDNVPRGVDGSRRLGTTPRQQEHCRLTAAGRSAGFWGGGSLPPPDPWGAIR